MPNMTELILADQQELVRTVHKLSKWQGGVFADPEAQDLERIHGWLDRSGWQSPTYNEVHRMAAESKLAEREKAKQQYGEYSHELHLIDRGLINTLLARYGLTLPTL